MPDTPFHKGFQIFALPITKGSWQFALFVLGYEFWTEDAEDHDAYEQETWYVQFLFWQFSYTREIDYDKKRR